MKNGDYERFLAQSARRRAKIKLYAKRNNNNFVATGRAFGITRQRAQQIVMGKK